MSSIDDTNFQSPGKLNNKSKNGMMGTPMTAMDSNLSNIPEQEFGQANNFGTVEQTLPLEESKQEDYKIQNKKKYKISPGVLFTGQMRAESNQKKAKLIPHGQGALTAKDGTVTEGLWRDGQIIEGLRIFKNGERYEGQFKND